MFEGLAKCLVGNVIAPRVVLCKRYQCTGVAFAMVEAGGSVVVGGEDEEVLSGGDAAESELAQPSQFFAGGRCEHIGLEANAAAAGPRSGGRRAWCPPRGRLQFA